MMGRTREEQGPIGEFGRPKTNLKDDIF